MRRRDFIAVLVPWRTGLVASPAAARSASGRVLVPDARLLDHAGGRTGCARCAGRPVVIGFFYTGCSTVCPPQTAMLCALRESA